MTRGPIGTGIHAAAFGVTTPPSSYVGIREMLVPAWTRSALNLASLPEQSLAARMFTGAVGDSVRGSYTQTWQLDRARRAVSMPPGMADLMASMRTTIRGVNGFDAIAGHALGADAWRQVTSTFALTGLQSLGRAAVDAGAVASSPTLVRDLELTSVQAFERMPVSGIADLITRPGQHGRRVERWLRADPELQDAVESVVDSDPLQDLVEGLGALDWADLAEHRRQQRRAGRAALGQRLDVLTVTQTCTLFAALYSLVTAAVLEFYGYGDTVGAVADTVAWPIGVVSLVAIVTRMNNQDGQ